MELDDIKVTRAIVEKFTKKFLDNLEVDVAIAGAGPAGLTAAYYLAKAGIKVAVFERKLSVGGGMWGGGIMFNEIVVQEEGKRILDEFEVKTEKHEEGYYTADSIETVATITSKAVKAGAKIFNLMSVEDVMFRQDKVTGLVLNWTSVEMANLHVDPVTMRAKYIIEATGHPTEVAHVIQRKTGKLMTPTGQIIGEKSMWADVGEKTILENTKELYPNVWAAGMAANAVFGGPRMGPIFGGMLLSGEKAAKILIEKLKQNV